jgi:drug/metabolite transporter (DMT)-like permease
MVSKLFTSALRWLAANPMRLAIGCILLSSTVFSVLNVSVRLLADTLDATVIMALRTLLTLVLLLPWWAAMGRPSLRTTRLSDHAWRGVVGGLGMLSWTYALTVMPLTEATALSFTAPLFATLFAIVFLGERAGRRRWLGLLCGFGGTLLVLQPSLAAFDSSALIVIGAAICWAATSILIKSLSATEPPLRMVFYMNVWMFLLVLPLALAHWKWPSAYAWGILLGMALCSLVMHLAMARAYALVPVVSLMPFDFTRLISTALLAYLVFGEVSNWLSWLGGAVILLSAAASLPRSKRPPPEPS